ncbi:hypothetical protein LEP1GSC150_0929, partial [Leptospira interrogans serovar Copenhageni str. LT2050]
GPKKNTFQRVNRNRVCGREFFFLGMALRNLVQNALDFQIQVQKLRFVVVKKMDFLFRSRRFWSWNSILCFGKNF